MVSILVPASVRLSVAPGYLKREGPRGTLVKKTGSLTFAVIETSDGTRLFLTSAQSRTTQTNGPERLSLLTAQREGLSRGYRRRLRLVGVGFRATLGRFAAATVSAKSTTPPTSTSSPATLTRKLGYSHEVRVSLAPRIAQGRDVRTSRLDGRTKGTLLRLQGVDRAKLHSLAASLRTFRRPDSYKGKGIHFDREVLRLKKGKRES